MKTKGPKQDSQNSTFIFHIYVFLNFNIHIPVHFLERLLV